MSLITVDGLSYAYPQGNLALSEISLTVEEGERVALMGSNGAGKSTLLYHLNGTLGLSAKVRINGLPVVKKHLDAIRRMVGVVFQNPDDQLFMGTVGEDVAFGLRNMGTPKDQVPKLVAQTLAAVGLDGFEDRSISALSVGEKKRAALATVLAMHPSVLCLDEPVAALDPRGRRELRDLLGALPLTMVIISHDLPLVRDLCHRVLILDHGRLVARGTPSDLFSDEDLLRSTGLI